MSVGPDKKQRRQMAYKARARRAFFFAKLMVPCAFLSVSAAAWSDPVLGPRLQTGLDEIKPMVEALMEGEPVMDVLADAGWPRETAKAEEEGPEAPEDETLDTASNMPATVVPINRPAPAPSPDS